MAGFALGPRAASRGYRLLAYDTIGSTSSEAGEAARRGDVGDVWVVAHRQTSGRGRRGRAWESPEGNLATSLLVVPEADPTVTATLGFVAGVALEDALSRVATGLTLRTGIDGADGPRSRVALKWPNDVLADGAKLAGILLEAHKRPDGSLAVVAGFGVNVVAAPEGLPYPATSLAGLGLRSPPRRCSPLWPTAGSTPSSCGTGAGVLRRSFSAGAPLRPVSVPKSRSTAMATSCAASLRPSTIPAA